MCDASPSSSSSVSLDPFALETTWKMSGTSDASFSGRMNAALMSRSYVDSAVVKFASPPKWSKPTHRTTVTSESRGFSTATAVASSAPSARVHASCSEKTARGTCDGSSPLCARGVVDDVARRVDVFRAG
eukprot:29137-Pelagococcus_subviridis.AAC.2